MSFGQFLSILKARWWLVLAVLVLSVGGTAGVSLKLPKQYTASTSVLVDVKPDPVSAMVYGGGMSPTFMASQVDIIKSERVAQRVVRNLNLGENPLIREQWLSATKGEGSLEQWLGSTFLKQMEVVPSRESSVITISYKAPDPKFAATLANAFAQAYVDTSVELRVDPARRYAAFFDTRAKEAREALEAAQMRVSKFQRENGIIATDERLDIETARLNELSSQLVAVQAQSSDTSSRRTQAGGASGDKMQEVLNNPVINALKSDLSRAEAKLEELNSRLGDNHPQVLELKAYINETRSKLTSETARVKGGVVVSADINRQREAELRASLEAQRAKVLKMKAVRDEGAVLVRDVENSQRALDAISTRLNQTNMESQSNQSNVSILAMAVPPLTHSSPKTTMNTLVATFVGTLLAIGLAVLLEMLDRRVRTPREIPDTVGLPVLGVLPRIGAVRASRKGLLADTRRLLGFSTAPKGARG